jgi:tetratricopeptide (TPR) repeat protein
MRWRVLLLTLAAASTVGAQGHRTRPEHDLLAYELVYRVPAMDQVTVERDVPYKKVAGGTLVVDLYYPPGFQRGSVLPAVLFVNGVGDQPDAPLRQWGQYRSWPRLVAARGMIGIAMGARSGEANAEDLRDVLRWVKQDGRAKGIDPARIAAWACSANVSAAVPLLMAGGEPAARAAVLYYGGGEAPSFRRDLPVLLVRAGRDRAFTNELIGRTLNAALAANAPWTLVNLPEMHHGFDCLDDTDDTRRAIGRTLAFLEDQLLAGGAAPLPAVEQVRPAPDHPPQAARAALAHFFAGEWAEAEAAYSAWVGAHPEDGDAWVFLGNAQVEAQHFDGARVSLRRAIELAPDVGESYAMLGRIEAENKNHAAAIPLLEKALVLMPEDAEAHHQLGGIYLAQKRYPEAVRQLEEAVRLAPGNGYAWNKLGIAVLATGGAERAVESFQHVLEYVPNDAAVLYNFACAQARAGHAGAALDALGRSIDNGYKDRKNLSSDPDLQSLRGEPRFAELVHRLPE